MKRDIFNNRGFSLVELILVLAIFSIIIPVAYSVFLVGNKSFAISKDRGFQQQEIRTMSIALNNQIRMSKDISLSDLTDKSVIIQDNIYDGNIISTIIINGLEYGPFKDTSFMINIDEHSLVLPVYSTEFSTIEETITVRFENWTSFIDVSQFVDPDTDDTIKFKQLHYSTY